MLDAAAETVPAAGMALDLGCGTGSAGFYLLSCGVPVVGLDLSLGMLRATSSGMLPSAQGDMRQLPFRDGSFALVVAFYSIQHVPRDLVGAVLEEVRRALHLGGFLLLATHLGDGDVYTSEFLGHRIGTTGGALYSDREITDRVINSGFSVVASEQRGPLEHEHPSQRIYLLAQSST
jgi:SAM-dependent methyltransferase